MALEALDEVKRLIASMLVHPLGLSESQRDMVMAMINAFMKAANAQPHSPQQLKAAIDLVRESADRYLPVGQWAAVTSFLDELSQRAAIE